MTPQIPRFTTSIIATTAQFFTQDQNDFIDLSVLKKPKKLYTFEKRKYRFDNNFCFYCRKPSHRIINHKITIQRVNFVLSILIDIISDGPVRHRIFSCNNTTTRKNLNLASSRLQKPPRFFIFVLNLIQTNLVEISINKHFVSRCTIKLNELFDDPIILFDTGV